VGRRNQYTVRQDLPLRHPLEGGAGVGDLLMVLKGDSPAGI
jgi:hypothetical protein